jgi:hypothetical protein
VQLDRLTIHIEQKEQPVIVHCTYYDSAGNPAWVVSNSPTDEQIISLFAAPDAGPAVEDPDRPGVFVVANPDGSRAEYIITEES